MYPLFCHTVLVCLWLALDPWFSCFPCEFYSFCLLLTEILLGLKAQLRFIYSLNDVNQSNFQAVSQNLRPSGFRNGPKVHLCLFSLIPVLSDHESHFRTGACLEVWLPDDFWLGASIIFSLCTCASFSSVIRDLIYWRGSTCNPFGKMFNGNSPGCDILDSKSSSGITVARFTCRYNQTFG